MSEKTYKEIRVRFLQSPEGMDLEGNKIPAKYSRPKSILEVKESVHIQYSVKENGEHVTKNKHTIRTTYKPAIRSASSMTVKPGKGIIKKETFITEWEKGPTPSPKRKEGRGFTCNDVKLGVKLLKKKYSEIREDLDSGKLTVQELQSKARLTNAEKKKRKEQQKEEKAIINNRETALADLKRSIATKRNRITFFKSLEITKKGKKNDTNVEKQIELLTLKISIYKELIKNIEKNQKKEEN